MSSSTAASVDRELDLADLVRRSWDLFTKKPVEHILCAAVYHVLSVFTLGILSAPLLVTYLRIIDRQRRGEPITVAQLFEFKGTGLTAFGLALLTIIGVGLGCCLLLLPGIVLFLGWFYGLWFVALAGQGVTDALGSAWRLFRANAGSVIIVVVVLVVLGSAGAVALLGTLITFPLGVLFATLAFSDMRQA
jgi:hypothetical protein